MSIDRAKSDCLGCVNGVAGEVGISRGRGKRARYQIIEKNRAAALAMDNTQQTIYQRTP
jgi:hypothetical protein